MSAKFLPRNVEYNPATFPNIRHPMKWDRSILSYDKLQKHVKNIVRLRIGKDGSARFEDLKKLFYITQYLLEFVDGDRQKFKNDLDTNRSGNITTLQRNLEDLDFQNRQLRTRNQNLKENVEDLKKENSGKQLVITNTKRENEQLTKRMRQLRNRLDSVTHNKTKQDTYKRLDEEKISNLETQLRELRGDNVLQRENVKKLEDGIIITRDKAEEFRAESVRFKKEREQKQKELEFLTEDHVKLRAELDQTTLRADTAENALLEYKSKGRTQSANQVVQLQEQLREMMEVYRKEKDEKERLDVMKDNEIVELKNDYQILSERERLVTSLEEEISELRDKVNTLQLERNQLKIKVDVSESSKKNPRSKSPLALRRSRTASPSKSPSRERRVVFEDEELGAGLEDEKATYRMIRMKREVEDAHKTLENVIKERDDLKVKYDLLSKEFQEKRKKWIGQIRKAEGGVVPDARKRVLYYREQIAMREEEIRKLKNRLLGRDKRIERLTIHLNNIAKEYQINQKRLRALAITPEDLKSQLDLEMDKIKLELIALRRNDEIQNTRITEKDGTIEELKKQIRPIPVTTEFETQTIVPYPTTPLPPPPLPDPPSPIVEEVEPTIVERFITIEKKDPETEKLVGEQIKLIEDLREQNGSLQNVVKANALHRQNLEEDVENYKMKVLSAQAKEEDMKKQFEMELQNVASSARSRTEAAKRKALMEAEKYEELSTLLTPNELFDQIKDLKQKVLDAEDELVILKSRNKDLEGIGELNNEISDLRFRLEKAIRNKESTGQRNEELRNKNDELMKGLRHLKVMEHEITIQKKEIDRLRGNQIDPNLRTAYEMQETMKELIESFNVRLATKDKQIEEKRAQIEELTEQLQKLEEESTTAIRDLRSSLRNREGVIKHELKAHREAVSKVADEVESMRPTDDGGIPSDLVSVWIEEKERYAEHLENEKKALEDMLQKIQEEKQAIQRNFEAQIESLRNQLQMGVKERERKVELEHIVKQLEEEIEELKSHDSLRMENRKLKNLLGEMRDNIANHGFKVAQGAVKKEREDNVRLKKKIMDLKSKHISNIQKQNDTYRGLVDQLKSENEKLKEEAETEETCSEKLSDMNNRLSQAHCRESELRRRLQGFIDEEDILKRILEHKTHRKVEELEKRIRVLLQRRRERSQKRVIDTLRTDNLRKTQNAVLHKTVAMASETASSEREEYYKKEMNRLLDHCTKLETNLEKSRRVARKYRKFEDRESELLIGMKTAEDASRKDKEAYEKLRKQVQVKNEELKNLKNVRIMEMAGEITRLRSEVEKSRLESNRIRMEKQKRVNVLNSELEKWKSKMEVLSSRLKQSHSIGNDEEEDDDDDDDEILDDGGIDDEEEEDEDGGVSSSAKKKKRDDVEENVSKKKRRRKRVVKRKGTKKRGRKKKGRRRGSKSQIIRTKEDLTKVLEIFETKQSEIAEKYQEENLRLQNEKLELQFENEKIKLHLSSYQSAHPISDDPSQQSIPGFSPIVSRKKSTTNKKRKKKSTSLANQLREKTEEIEIFKSALEKMQEELKKIKARSISNFKYIDLLKKYKALQQQQKKDRENSNNIISSHPSSSSSSQQQQQKINHLRKRVTALLKQGNRSKKRIETLGRELEERESVNRHLQSELDKFTQESGHLKQQLSKLLTQKKKMRMKKMRTFQGDEDPEEEEDEERIKKKKRMEIEAFHETLTKLNSEILLYREKNRDLERQLERTKNQLEVATRKEQKIPFSDRNNNNPTIQELQKKNVMNETRVQHLQTELDRLQGLVSSTKSRNLVLERSNFELRQQLDQFDEEFFEEIEDLKYDFAVTSKKMHTYRKRLKQFGLLGRGQDTSPSSSSRHRHQKSRRREQHEKPTRILVDDDDDEKDNNESESEGDDSGHHLIDEEENLMLEMMMVKRRKKRENQKRKEDEERENTQKMAEDFVRRSQENPMVENPNIKVGYAKHRYAL